MNLQTEKAIISAAREVFSAHGYKHTNMSLISKHAGFSRVTVHKYLANKDDAFRKSIQQILFDGQLACAPIMAQSELELPCWQAIESLLELWMKPIFDEVNDHLLLQELRYHAQEIAQDLISEAHHTIENMISRVLTLAVNNKEIDLTPLQLSANDLAQLIVSGVGGLRIRADITDIEQASRNLIKVFKAASAV